MNYDNITWEELEELQRFGYIERADDFDDECEEWFSELYDDDDDNYWFEMSYRRIPATTNHFSY